MPPRPHPPATRSLWNVIFQVQFFIYHDTKIFYNLRGLFVVVKSLYHHGYKELYSLVNIAFFCGALIVIKLAFLLLIEILLISHRLFTLISSMFIVFSSSLALLEAKILVSSANIRKDNLSEELEMSLMYNRNTVLPWGIPHGMEYHL